MVAPLAPTKWHDEYQIGISTRRSGDNMYGRTRWNDARPYLIGVLLLALGPSGLGMQPAEQTMEQPVRAVVAEGHVEAILGVAFSPDGKYLASGGDEGEIVIWDATTWQELRKLQGDPAGRKGHYEDVWGVAFSPN